MTDNYIENISFTLLLFIAGFAVADGFSYDV